jgi:hypothetical protein
VQLVVFTDLFPVTTNPSSKLLYLTPIGTSVPPDAPTITGYVPYSGRIEVSFTLNSDGGSPLQSIFYTTDAGNTWYGVESSISGGVLTVYNTSSNQPLENGVPYTFQFAISTVDFSNASANPASAPFTMIPSDAVFTPPEYPIITSISAGDQSLTVSFDLGVLGSTLTGIFYKTDSGPWLDTKSTDSPLVLTKDSYFNPLVNGTAYSIQLVVVTVDFPVPRDNTPSESFSATPLAVPVPPDTPSSITYTPGDGTLTLSYILGSNGGSYFTAVYYTTDGGSNWNILTSTPGIGDSIITTESDGSTPLVNGNVYFVQLVSTTADFPDPTMNTPSEAIFMSPSAVILPPSAPVIVSWFGTDGALTVRYTIPTDGGSPVTDVYYSTDNGLTWDPTATTRGTAVITHTSDGLGPIVDSTTYSVRLVAVTVGFPVPYTNPKSARVFMVARPVKPGTFKPKGMSYTEFLRSKKADSPKIFNTKLLRSASEITTARRLGSSTVFALNNQGVKGSISNSIDFAQGGLHATQSYFKGEGTSRRVGSASEFTAYAGSQAIGGLVQAGLPPARILQTSNFIFVSRPVSQSASDYLRRDHGVKVSLGQPHDLEGVTPPVFVDNTVRNTGSPATVSRPAIHEIKAKNAFAYVPNRPSQAGGQYALKGDAQPGKELGALGGTTHYKAGGALRKVPYVEKHHGNDLGVNPKRPFVRYQIPAGATPVHLKINKPINSI